MADADNTENDMQNVKIDADYRTIALFLWSLLDDIDTATDMAKSNDAAYRNYVETVQRRRYEVGTSDGYKIAFNCDPVPVDADSIEYKSAQAEPERAVSKEEIVFFEQILDGYEAPEPSPRPKEK